ncbi:Protein of unknown function [Tenacibaculum jejuense]|uniref:Tetratricopeptide repeat protein n=2 Tax=Tenacibaculum jejuense TaxID=584609 RepID=A0A238U515_9FLAO|nr:Protein of unknown function [Tenacibaculum jejuense]
MGGYGSIQPLLNSNKDLLRKKSLFKNKDKKVKSEEGELEFIKLSDEELKLLKKEMAKKSWKEKVLGVFTVVFVIAFVGFTASYLIQQNRVYEEYIASKNHQHKLNEFNINIKKGDEFYYQGHYKNALFFYTKSSTLFPENSLVKTKMNNCYRLRCENENIDCNKLVR